ncbi:unnamed protein product [Dibothriocephalus latus]|uniref:Uncharacterized protein n=1 Tax=Dibothriocephalus latus TaxID=60516 RepID=A0A3P6UYC9_DIBLA|nr:unnamed protein product [Dibothriocephalus latus]
MDSCKRLNAHDNELIDPVVVFLEKKLASVRKAWTELNSQKDSLVKSRQNQAACKVMLNWGHSAVTDELGLQAFYTLIKAKQAIDATSAEKEESFESLGRQVMILLQRCHRLLLAANSVWWETNAFDVKIYELMVRTTIKEADNLARTVKACEEDDYNYLIISPEFKQVS